MTPEISREPQHDSEEQQFRLLVASIKDYAIFTLDRSGRVTTWNSGAQRIKGYNADEIIGKHFSIFYSPEDIAGSRPQKLLDIVLAEGRVEDEGWRVRKDGTRFWASVVITPLRGTDGSVLGFAKVTRDLTKQREAEEKLRRSEESLSATLYSIGDGVMAADERACVTRINPVAERMTGWLEKDAIGRPIDEVFNIINEETRARAPNPVTRVLAEGVVVGLANHTALIARDGTERPIADSGAPIRNAQGVTNGAVLVFRDVSEERVAEDALRQSEEKLRLMIASVSDYAIFMLDPDGLVATWNPGVERITGYKKDEILGSHFSRFLTPEGRADKSARELREAATAGRFEEESWRVRRDGSRFWANVVITPMWDASNKLVGFVKITRDLTENRKLENERLRLAQAQEAVRLRDEFLSIASHEIKTPLTALQLQLQALLDRTTPQERDAVERVRRVMRVGSRLQQLTDALLDVSRIATGRLKLNYEEFDLVEAAREVVERLREASMGAECELSLRADGPIRGHWDRLRVEQILMNLISNAMKYGAGKPILVSARPDAESATFVVRDWGPGVPESELSRIFERFERAASTRHYGGLGLGLYVARQIAEAHGGHITVFNEPDGGASFAVCLPLGLQGSAR